MVRGFVLLTEAEQAGSFYTPGLLCSMGIVRMAIEHTPPVASRQPPHGGGLLRWCCRGAKPPSLRGVARRKACQGESAQLLRRIQHPQGLQLIHLFRAVKAALCIVLHQAAFDRPLFRLSCHAQGFAI